MSIAVRISVVALAAAVLIVAPLATRLLSSPHDMGDLAGHAAVDGADMMGIASYVLAGPFPRDGIQPRQRRVLVLGAATGQLVLDLGRAESISAMLIQAFPGDRYAVEGSLDRKDWTEIWSVPASSFDRGLRARDALFSPSIDVNRPGFAGGSIS